jgi:7-cyano-7-deazaguanine synthase
MRDAVCLASGGLDSSVCLALLTQQGLNPLPIFIDYGQLNCEAEFRALIHNCSVLGVDEPIRLDLSSFGRTLSTGLTDATKHIVDDAFTPCRNLLFIVTAAAIAYKHGSQRIVMGLLSEATCIFPDQTDKFIAAAENAISVSLGVNMKIVVPLREMTKQDVVKLATEIQLDTYYSCHAGGVEPCGKCIACLEYGADYGR